MKITTTLAFNYTVIKEPGDIPFIVSEDRQTITGGGLVAFLHEAPSEDSMWMSREQSYQRWGGAPPPFPVFALAEDPQGGLEADPEPAPLRERTHWRIFRVEDLLAHGDYTHIKTAALTKEKALLRLRRIAAEGGEAGEEEIGDDQSRIGRFLGKISSSHISGTPETGLGDGERLWNFYDTSLPGRLTNLEPLEVVESQSPEACITAMCLRLADPEQIRQAERIALEAAQIGLRQP
jgi:hypothetical protein